MSYWPEKGAANKDAWDEYYNVEIRLLFVCPFHFFCINFRICMLFFFGISNLSLYLNIYHL